MAVLLPVLISWMISCPVLTYQPFHIYKRAFWGTCRNIAKNDVLKDIKLIAMDPSGFRTSLERVCCEY
jgi:hypothetical protein